MGRFLRRNRLIYSVKVRFLEVTWHMRKIVRMESCMQITWFYGVAKKKRVACMVCPPLEFLIGIRINATFHRNCGVDGA